MLNARQIGEEGFEVREANHRMVNMLATLLAVFRRNFSKFSDQQVRGAAAKFESQMIATSELFRAISSAPPAEDVAIDVYLERLGSALASAVLSPMNRKVELFADHGRLPIDVCERLGIIVVELVINASKYAFADRNNGVVRIEMTRSRRYWHCTVSDNGVGMSGAGRGTGLNIVDALVRSLKGRLIIKTGASGTCACVILPDQSARRGDGPEQDVIDAVPASVGSAQKSHWQNRMDNRFVA